jgi:hypothetical protein
MGRPEFLQTRFLEDFGFLIVVMIIVLIGATSVFTMITGNFWGSLVIGTILAVIIASNTIIIN